jgi:uncharacterized protein YegL
MEAYMQSSIIPTGYSRFDKYLRQKIDFSNDTSLITASLNLIDYFIKLHSKGCNFQDFNIYDFYMNFDNGEVIFVDNSTSSRIENNLIHLLNYKYTAPEVVRGDKKPDNQTDRYLLAVVLFLLLFVDHPLEGKYSVITDFILTKEDEKRIYGTDPIFIFDPIDKKNAPNKLTSANAINIWNLVPDYIRNMFIDAFDHDRLYGIKPHLSETTWIKAFIRWRSEIVKCFCGRENYSLPNGEFTCGCGKIRRIPAYLKFQNHDVPIYPGVELYACHTITDNEDFRTKTAEIVTNAKDPRVLGLRNLSDSVWKVTGADGIPQAKGKNAVVKVSNGVTIDFGHNCTAQILSNKKEIGMAVTDVVREVVPRKTIVLFFLIDTSGGMAGTRIGTLNSVMEQTLEKLAEMNASNPDAEIEIAVLEFSTSAKWVTPNGPLKIEGYTWSDLEAGGLRNMGTAFDLLDKALHSNGGFLKQNHYKPQIFIFTDGVPHDQYENSLKKLKNNSWFLESTRIAIPIGNDVDEQILIDFTGTKETIIHIQDGKTLADKLVKMIQFRAVVTS